MWFPKVPGAGAGITAVLKCRCSTLLHLIAYHSANHHPKTRSGPVEEQRCRRDRGLRTPTPGYLAWEIVRLGYDPRSALSNGVESWLKGCTDLTHAYRDANPTAPADDLLSSLRVGCAAMLCATFPLSAPVERPHIVDAALESYARARHEAALMLLDQLPVLEEALRDTRHPRLLVRAAVRQPTRRPGPPDGGIPTEPPTITPIRH
ncbi:hypothetical protein [Kitasatospora sp. LaBMicrA B282]|uniref:hypothetical protein n=1 Tax=Kitasatospora sp. LaBMicrA B282 TaxID=3420949 RepID=UPI003D09C03F